MNKERLTKIAEWLEAGAKHDLITFDMTSGVRFTQEVPHDPDKAPYCASSCCIAGAAVQFFGGFSEDDLESIDTERFDGHAEIAWDHILPKARELLDLDHFTAERLFTPNDFFVVPGSHGSLKAFNDPAWAARVIRGFIATDAVDWLKYRYKTTEAV